MEATNAALILPSPETRSPLSDIHDIRPLVEAPPSWAWLWWGLLAAALLTLLYWACRCWKKQRQNQPAKPTTHQELPHERARRLLENVSAYLHDPERFCVIVSDAIRGYLEDRFGLKAPERTTEEFLGELQESRYLAENQKQLLADFLAKCDLVKFAKSQPEAYELNKLREAALQLVRETEPSPLDLPDTTNAQPNPTAAPPPLPQ